MGNRISKVTLVPPFDVSTLAGSGEFDQLDAVGTSAAFAGPTGLAASPEFVFVADTQNDAIRQVRLSDGSVTTVAGAWQEVPHDGALDGVGREARFMAPTGVALSQDEKLVYVADMGNQVIRRIDLLSGQVATIAGVGEAGFKDGGARGLFHLPKDLALLPDGHHLLVTDSKNNVLRLVDTESCDKDGANCHVATLAGLPTPGSVGGAELDGLGPRARLGEPLYLSVYAHSDDSVKFAITEGSRAIRLAELVFDDDVFGDDDDDDDDGDDDDDDDER